MFKKLFILFLIVAPIGVYAQDKLAYINTQEVFTQMPEIKDVETKLAAKQEEIKKNLAAIQAEYDKKMEEFKASTAEPTEAVLTDRQKQVQQIQERYETYLENSDKEFQDLRQQLLAPLQQKMQAAIKSVGEKNGYTYIIEVGAVPYVSTSAVDAGKLVKAELGIK
uniref:OmpH family outer membrane protein n=1 Tax=uncultured Dysgonomonas sp. TaxID=206096 RepID=UPI0026063505|nr:OmpH family outer membrane protein [uncultured Dysgonomonas sp.]